MTYEAWRISYQSAEQAARAAYRRAEELAAKLAELEGQEPAFWYRPSSAGEMYDGPIHNAQIERVRRLSGAWVPLFARSAPAEPVNARLVDIAVGKLLHTYGGLCPDSVTGHGSLDPECPACRAIAAAEAKQADRAPKNNPRPERMDSAAHLFTGMPRSSTDPRETASELT